MKCKLQKKYEAFGEFKFGLTEMCFSSQAWDISVNQDDFEAALPV